MCEASISTCLLGSNIPCKNNAWFLFCPRCIRVACERAPLLSYLTRFPRRNRTGKCRRFEHDNVCFTSPLESVAHKSRHDGFAASRRADNVFFIQKPFVTLSFTCRSLVAQEAISLTMLQTSMKRSRTKSCCATSTAYLSFPDSLCQQAPLETHDKANQC